jgi:hypothetical protein
MNEGTPTHAPSAARRELLLSAFQDAEGTIRATDTKASIGLVVNGFLFAGLLGVLSQLAWFEDADGCFRSVTIALSAGTGVIFFTSVVQLLRCVIPAPRSVLPHTPQPCVFFLEGSASRIGARPANMPDLNEVRGRILQLDEAGIEDELAAELLKVSAIRIRKVALAQSGFELLGLEVLSSLILLAALAINRL